MAAIVEAALSAVAVVVSPGVAAAEAAEAEVLAAEEGDSLNLSV